MFGATYYLHRVMDEVERKSGVRYVGMHVCGMYVCMYVWGMFLPIELCVFNVTSVSSIFDTYDVS